MSKSAETLLAGTWIHNEIIILGEYSTQAQSTVLWLPQQDEMTPATFKRIESNAEN